MSGFAAEWQQWLPALASEEGNQIATIYFGGGTPALFGPERIAEIIRWVRRDLPFSSTNPEITLEANPENITKDLMKRYAEAGINRVSIGIQTLDESLLNRLSRLHSPQVAIDAVINTFETGINNISIDLMYDLPGQNLDSWKLTLDRAVQLPIKHLSLYNLTIEPHTVFFKQRETIQKQLPDETISLFMYEEAIAAMQSGGLSQYEISAFAKEGYHSRHNVGYWTGRPFLGLGPSAFSYWEGRRFRNVANLSKYYKALELGQSPIDFNEKLDTVLASREMLAINLRLIAGVDLDSFQQAHGQLDEETSATITRLLQEGYLTKESSVLRLTKRGILFYDTVAVEIV